MMPPNTPAAASQPGAAPQPSTTVCIAAMGDGTFKVYLDDDSEADPAAGAPASGGAGEEQDEMAGAQTAPDIDTALDMARQMLGGQGGAQEDSADALFQGGFNKARGVPLNRA